MNRPVSDYRGPNKTGEMAVSVTSIAINARNSPGRDQVSNGLGLLDTDDLHADKYQSRTKRSPGLSLHLNAQSPTNRDDSPPVQSKMTTNRGRLQRGSTEPILSSESPLGSRPVRPTLHSPGSPPVHQSPLSARSFLAAKIGEHQRREALSSSSSPDTKSPSSVVFHQTSQVPTSPHATMNGQAKENHPTSPPESAERPQSPVFGDKIWTDVVVTEMVKESAYVNAPVETVVVNGDISNGVTSSTSGDIAVEESEEYSPSTVQEKRNASQALPLLTNGHIDKSGVNGKVDTTNTKGSTHKASSPVAIPQNSHQRSVFVWSVASSAPTSASTRPAATDGSGHQDGGDVRFGPPPERSTSSPDLSSQDPIAGPAMSSHKARITSPPVSPSRKSRFSAWFKKSSRQEASTTEAAQLSQESPKKGGRKSVSPTRPAMVNSPVEGRDIVSPSKKHSRKLSAKLPNFLRRDRKSSKEDLLASTVEYPTVPRSGSIESGLDLQANRESNLGGLSKTHSADDLLDSTTGVLGIQPASTEQGRDGSKNSTSEKKETSEATLKLDTTAKSVESSHKAVTWEAPTEQPVPQQAVATKERRTSMYEPKDVAARGRRTSMYEPRAPAFSRVKSPGTSASATSPTSTKAAAAKTSSKTADTKKTTVGATTGGASVKRTPSTASNSSRKSQDSLKVASATSMKSSSSTSLKSSSATSLTAQAGSSTQRPSSAASNASRGSTKRPTSATGTKTASSASKTAATSKKTSSVGRPASSSSTKTASSSSNNTTATSKISVTGGRPASGTGTKTASTIKSTTASKSSATEGAPKKTSTLRNVLRAASPKRTSLSTTKATRSKSVTTPPERKALNTTPARKTSAASTSLKGMPKVGTSTSSKAPAKASAANVKKPPAGSSAVRRRESYAMAITEQSSNKAVRKKSSTLGSVTMENVPPEIGPPPTALIEVEPRKVSVKEEEEQRLPSSSSLLGSVMEEAEEEVDGQGLSTHRGSGRKSTKSTQKVIERPIGTGSIGRRRSVVTVTPSPTAKSPKTDSKHAGGTRRYSTAAAISPGLSHTLGRTAPRRQSAAEVGYRSATLGGRRNSAYARRETAPTLMHLDQALEEMEQEEQAEKSAEAGGRRRKSSLEGIKDFLKTSATKTLTRRKRRSSGEGPNEKVSTTSQDTIEEFENITRSTSDARLKHQDHRLAVRPRMQRPPSSAHLQNLKEREDVFSEIRPSRSVTFDNATWSTYLAKKDMDPKAEAGLALKIDFSAVKLRKTVSNPGEERERSEAVGGPNSVVEYCDPTKLLLHIKGRRHLHTVLVEPSSSSLNSGDVFILVTEKDLIQWVGAKANILEKAKGTELLERISKKKELGCKCSSFMTIEEQKSEKKASVFWDHLGGKQKVKAADIIAADDVYEKAMSATTIIYEWQGEGVDGKYVVARKDFHQKPSKEMLDTTKMYVLDFMTEMYIWIGKQSKIGQRKRAQIHARELFDAGYYPSPFERRPSSARRSSRGSLRSVRRSSKGDVRSSIGKGKGKTGASAAQVSGLAASVTGGPLVERIRRPRPKWALFNRINEGSETILFREKFSDWPDDSRIIKMKGHVSSGEVMEIGPMPEPGAIDSKVFLQPQEAYKGLVLEGENVYRGRGRMRPDDVRGSKVTTVALKQWWIKEYDHSLLLEEDFGIFHSAEGYVIRWAFRASVLRSLEGLGLSQNRGRGNRPVTWHVGDPAAFRGLSQAIGGGDPFAEDSPDEGEDGQKSSVTESGGSDRCAYFFWQGIDCTITEKGAAALMTVELDEERGPQVRVPQGEEMPAFFSMFDGSMIILDGKWDANPLHINPDVKPCRFFVVRGLTKSEACLIEIPWTSNVSMAEHLRSRCCFLLHHLAGDHFYLWHGSKSTTTLQKVAKRALVRLRRRFEAGSQVTVVNEGEEPSVFWTLMEGKGEYQSLVSFSRALEFTPRLWLLSSSTGEFVANEVLYPCRNGTTEAFPVLQSDLYTAEQPALFLMDVHYEIYVWVGWWPVQADARFREKNQFTGDAIVRFTRDKRLAMETAINYAEACGRIIEPRVYVVFAGYEHAKFIDHFPFWQVDDGVVESNKQHVTVRYTHRSEAVDELKKLCRDRYTLKELQARPLPEGVDPKRLETYLGDEEFNSVFKMSKGEFVKLPVWKQSSLKKSAQLF